MERLTYRDKEGRAQWMPELLEDDSGLAGALIYTLSLHDALPIYC